MMANVPDLALPNVALPIARGQRGCLTKNPQSARRLCPKSVHSTTIGSFKLMHYRLGGLRPMHPIGSPTNPRLGWKNDWFGGQKTRAPAGALVTHHADEQ